jgi:hypothetical protein
MNGVVNMSVKGQRAGSGWTVLAILLVVSTGCSSVMSSATANLADSLTGAILNQNDPETVRQGAPAYLLLIDGLIAESPGNTSLLLAGAGLYSSYAGAFVEDRERATRLSIKGRDYGWRAMCSGDRSTCGSWSAPYDEFEKAVSGMGVKELPVLYGAGAAWATWIMSNKSDWSAVADKARVDAMMQRVVEIDESYDDGSAFLYLGVLATILPEAMGGKPEEGKAAFERAIELSGGRNLMAKVLLAENYAKLVFDRELYDRLCQEVIEADPEVPGLTLANSLAQEKARVLLADSEDYFGD